MGPVKVFTTLSSDMFPQSWRGGDIDAKATALAPEEVDRSLRLVRLALTRYPEPVLNKNLRRIYLVRDLLFFGVPYGATNSLDCLYLCNRGVREGFTDWYLESSVYHEFSSILLRNYPKFWDEKAWLAANPKGFHYLGDGTQAIRQGAASLDRDPKLYRLGFLTAYSQASVEEDFNVMTESLFMGDSGFWRAVDTYPRLRKKLEVALKLYGGIDRQFTESRFRKLRRSSRG
jgi:hypothetical protein